MKTTTFAYVRRMLAGRLQFLSTEIGKADAPNGEQLSDLATVSATLIDFVSSSQEPVDYDTAHAIACRDELDRSRDHLLEVEKFFATGTGSGSETHKAVQRLVALTQQ